jgi:putative PIN family toxin of toxin-antitoxin system
VTPRAVLDTNILVSGLGWGGHPAAILDAVSDGRVVLITSAPLLDELRRVLAYPKLAKVVSDAARLADIIAASSVVVEPDRVLAIINDESDNRVLEAAAAASADYIVSGDADLLDLGFFEGIPIVTAAQFVTTVLNRGSGEL